MRLGDHIAVDRGVYVHHGIALAPGRVVHFTGEPLRWSEARIEVDALSAFARGGRVVRVDSPRVYPRREVVRRALLRRGEGGY